MNRDLLATVTSRGPQVVYSMARSRSINPNAIRLPENVVWITIDETDANSHRWPTNTTANPDADGHVNFMQPLALDCSASIKWRMTCGASIAEMQKMPDHRAYITDIAMWVDQALCASQCRNEAIRAEGLATRIPVLRPQQRDAT